MAKFIYKNQLEELATHLLQIGRVVAPIEKHAHSGASKVVFTDYTPGARLEVDYPTTVLPPKEFLFPNNETVFEFRDGQIKKDQPEKTIIFGVSYSDLEGLAKLKTVFKKPSEDKVFEDRARNTIIIGIDRFSAPKNITYDLYLQKISLNKYSALAGSTAGQKILRLPLFKNEKATVPQVKMGKDELLSDPLLSEAVERSRNHPVWDELAIECFACGICSFTCPLCYCFETEDTTTLPTKAPLSGKRTRQWSTCFSEDFAKTAGHNFRPDRKDRIYNWYHHKFVRMPKEFGFSGCVDCNRCTIFCPAHIDYRQVLTRILKDYKEKKR